MPVRLLIALVAVALLVPATGCARLEKAFTPPPKVVTQEATVAASGVEVTGDLGEVPEGLPLWPGAEVVDQKSMDGAYALTLVTTENYDDVLKGVIVGFERAKWEAAQDDAVTGEEGIASIAVANEQFEGFVTLTQADDGSVQIDYLISPAE